MIVPKKTPNDIQICADFKNTLNKIIIQCQPLPTAENMFQKSLGTNTFVVSDLNQAYLQL